MTSSSSRSFPNVENEALSSGIIFLRVQPPHASWKKSSHGAADSSIPSIIMAAKIQTGFYVRGLPFRTNRQGDDMLEVFGLSSNAYS